MNETTTTTTTTTDDQSERASLLEEAFVFTGEDDRDLSAFAYGTFLVNAAAQAYLAGKPNGLELLKHAARVNDLLAPEIERQRAKHADEWERYEQTKREGRLTSSNHGEAR